MATRPLTPALPSFLKLTVMSTVSPASGYGSPSVQEAVTPSLIDQEATFMLAEGATVSPQIETSSM